MAISQDYQFEYTNPDGNSLVIGAGTNYDITDMRGFGMPNVRANDVPRLDEHGTFTSRKELLDGRSINIRVRVLGTPGNELDAALVNLSKAFQVNDAPGTLQFKFPIGWGTSDTVNDERFVKCYVRRVTKQILARNSAGVVPVFIALECPNPIINSAELHTTALALTTFTGGATFNATFNLSFGTGESLATICSNVGDFPANPIITFHGPATTPRITNNTSGQYIELAGLTLASGEYAEVNFYDRSILKGGSTSVYNTLTSASNWWTLKPGDNSVTFSASSSTATTCDISWYDAWI